MAFVFPVKKKDLEIVINNFDIEEGILTLYVPYPENYPNTDFKLNNDKKRIAYLQMDFSDVETKGYISLDFFYVYSSKSNQRSKYATKEEMNLTKGLGKKILCSAINLLIDNKIVDTKTTMIKLNAAGGYCASEEDVNYILRTFSEEKMNEYINIYINSHNKIKLLNSSPKEKAMIICKAQDNIKLMKYYQEYGLNPDIIEKEKIDLTYIPMTGYIYNVLKKCQNKPEEHITSKVEEIGDKLTSKVEEIDKGDKRKSKMRRSKKNNKRSKKKSKRRKCKRKSKKSKRKSKKSKRGKSK